MGRSKSKRGGPPLFELLQGHRFRRGDAGPNQPELRGVLPVPEVAEEEVETAIPVRFAPPDEASPSSNVPAAVQLLGDRLHLSLTRAGLQRFETVSGEAEQRYGQIERHLGRAKLRSLMSILREFDRLEPAPARRNRRGR